MTRFSSIETDGLNRAIADNAALDKPLSERALAQHVYQCFSTYGIGSGRTVQSIYGAIRTINRKAKQAEQAQQSGSDPVPTSPKARRRKQSLVTA